MSTQLLSRVRCLRRSWPLVAWFGMNACAVYDEQPFVTGSTSGSPPSTALAAGAVAGAVAPQPEPAEPACASTIEADPCDALPRLAAVPQIDGVLECGLTLHALTLPGVPLEAAQPTATYAAAWSDAGFYVYVEVHAGPSPARTEREPLYCADAVEIFVDGDGSASLDGGYNAPGTMQFVVGAPSGAEMATERYLAGSAQGPWISSHLSISALADGYAVETLIVGGDLGLWSWQPSGQIGFNLAVNVAGVGDPRGAPCTTGVGQGVLRVAAPERDCDGKPWCDTRSFCRPALAQ